MEAFGGPVRGDGADAAVADGGGSPVHASSWAKDGCSSASFAIRYTATFTSRARYSYKYEYDCLSLYVHYKFTTWSFTKAVKFIGHSSSFAAEGSTSHIHMVEYKSKIQ
jgi:hypothetical protein